MKYRLQKEEIEALLNAIYTHLEETIGTKDPEIKAERKLLKALAKRMLRALRREE